MLYSDKLTFVTQNLFTNANELHVDDLLTLKLIFSSDKQILKILDNGIDIDDLKDLTLDVLVNLKFRKDSSENILNNIKNLGELRDQAFRISEWCGDNNIEILSKNSSCYPRRFKDLSDPPVLIFCQGNLSLLNKKKSVAVVGSRKMSTEGSVIAKRVSEFFSSNDVNIVSGLALGIDTEAHNAALSTGGLTTAIVVDLNKINPPSNINLAKKICKNDGLIMSENIPGTSSGEKYLFTMRNRLQSSLSKVVLVIEAGKDSGTRSTANAALKQSKKLYCADLLQFPNYQRNSFEGSLNKEYIESGKANIFSKETYQEILDLLNE